MMTGAEALDRFEPAIGKPAPVQRRAMQLILDAMCAEHGLHPTTPAPETVAAARAAAGLTMAEAGAVVHRPNYRRWSEWERGVTAMPLAEWELFVMKTFPRGEWSKWLT